MSAVIMFVIILSFFCGMLSPNGASHTGGKMKPSMGHHYQRDVVFKGIFGM